VDDGVKALVLNTDDVFNMWMLNTDDVFNLWMLNTDDVFNLWMYDVADAVRIRGIRRGRRRDGRFQAIYIVMLNIVS
jgi:hypothetical protein